MGGDRAWLDGLDRFGIRPGLERIRALLDALGRPDLRAATVLVAGTNGKGSTTALLHSMLVADGRRAGRFVSPHLQRFEERVTVGRDAASPDAIDAVLARLREPASRIGATYFEVVTALALELFAREGVELAVLEVGMGGRWDATNAVEPILSIVTGVDLDHVDVLGPTRADIAREKAGVARRDRPLLTAASGPARRVVLDAADAAGARAWHLAAAHLRVEDRGWGGVAVSLDVPTGERWTLRTPLLGRHQATNLGLAAAAASLLGVRERAAREGAATVSWPGRLEPIERRGRRWLLDGAHNVAGARALAAALRALAPGGAGALVFGTSADKDVGGMIEELTGLARNVVLAAAAASPRALTVERLAERWGAGGGPVTRRREADAGAAPGSPHVAADPATALELADRLAPAGSVVVVAGSLFLVGEARALLLGDAPPTGPRWQ